MDKWILKVIQFVSKALSVIGLGLQRDFQARLEEQKRESEIQLQKEMAQISSQVAEDIRGPLMALTTLTHLSHEMTQDKKELLQVAVSRVRGIVDDLLKRTALFSATEIFPAHSTNSSDLFSVVEPLLKEYKFAHPQTRWSLHNHLSSPRAVVDLNTVQLQRILSHLLNNALASGPENEASIEVTLMERADHFILQIIDNGSGKNLDRHADDDHPLEDDRHLEARKALASLGGDLQIRSREGVGTQVILLFPKKLISQEIQVM